MTLFDSSTRIFSGLPLEAEPSFSYLNRSSRIEAQRIRELLSRFLDRYPSTHRSALASRFSSPIDAVHGSALFELLLHELLLRAGHRIVAIEPPLPHTAKSPDFLIESSRGGKFYLEAALTTGQSEAATAAEARLNAALDAIQSVPSPDYYLDVAIRGTPTAPVRQRRLKHELRQWIGNLPSAVPFIYTEHGITFRILAHARSISTTSEPTIGIQSTGFKRIVAVPTIRSTLLQKASRYGTLDAQYVVAINAQGRTRTLRFVMDALFGRNALVAEGIGTDREQTYQTRAPDGVWAGLRIQNRRLSAVVAFDRIDAWNLARRTAVLIRNPWATFPLPEGMLALPEATTADNAFRPPPGRSVGEMLGLSEDWPE